MHLPTKALGATPFYPPLRAAAIPLIAGLAVSLSACTTPPVSPFQTMTQRDLRNSVADAARREIQDAQKQPTPVVTTRVSGIEGLGIKPEQMPELEQMAGPQAYQTSPLPLTDDLMGQPARTLTVSLERLLKTAAEKNIAVQFAHIGPAVAESQLLAAEAAFDWTFFDNLQYQNINEPQVNTSTIATGLLPSQFQTVSDSVGLRRNLVGGGRISIQEDMAYTANTGFGQVFTPNPASPTSMTVQWDQPLLKNFGSEVSQAEIRVDRNAERGSVQTMRRDLMKVLNDTEKAYWDLVQARYDVLILERLLERGEKVRDQLRERANIDANQAQIADAVSRVERRKADVLRAQTQLRLTSDRLKALVNDPDFPAGSEMVLLPADAAVDEPIQFSLVESLSTAVQQRPEVQQSILSIDDASIRQTVAQNGRLPDLNLRFQTKWSALDKNFLSSLGKQFNQDFVDYVVGLSFEMPIGNRKAEAQYRQRVLERTQSVLAYRNTVQQVVGEVKSALEQSVLNYRLIAQTKTSRIAAANVLRVLMVEKEIGTPGYSVERLDLELTRQESLAQAERDEVQAMTQYNGSIADLFLAMGTTLERNNIQFVVPTSDDTLEGVHGTKGWAGEPVAKKPKGSP